jgi:hypothetical protein
MKLPSWIALLFISMVGSLTVAMSSYHYDLSADTLVNYLISLIHWTPFYWDQDRYGMLIPGLCAWITDPVSNAICQSALHALTSFLTFFLLAKFLWRDRWLEAGALAAIGYCALSGTGDLNSFLTPWQIYTPAMLFGLLGLLLAERSIYRSFALLCVAEWCNFSVNILLAIVVLLAGLERYGRHGRRAFPRLEGEVVLLATSSVIGLMIQRAFAVRSSSGYALFKSVTAVSGWIKFLESYVTGYQYSLWLLLLPPVLGMAALVYGFRQRKRARAIVLRRGLVALVSLLLYAMVVGASDFARFNGYPARYLIPSVMIWLVLWSGVVVQALPLRTGDSRTLLATWTTALTLALILILRFGIPSRAAVENAFTRRLGPKYDDVVRANCTHVVGNYYRVWESVFYSRVRGDRPLWGITFRADITHDQWDPEKWQFEKLTSPRICYWKDDESEALEFLRDFALWDFVTVSTVGDMVVLEKVRRSFF